MKFGRDKGQMRKISKDRRNNLNEKIISFDLKQLVAFFEIGYC